MIQMDGGGRAGQENRPAAVRDPAAYIRLPSPEIEAGKAQDRNAALAVVAGTEKAASRIIQYPSDTDFNISTDIGRPLRRTRTLTHRLRSLKHPLRWLAFQVEEMARLE